jgi:cysteine synthase B
MLAVKEGIFSGMSSGAAMHVAINKSSELQEGVIVVILPDRGDRYLSTALFTSVCGKCPP